MVELWKKGRLSSARTQGTYESGLRRSGSLTALVPFVRWFTFCYGSLDYLVHFVAWFPSYGGSLLKPVPYLNWFTL